MARRYKHLSDGEPRVIKALKGAPPGEFVHKVMCCDCGLVHFMRVDVLSDTSIKMTAWRDERATAIRRKRRGKTKRG